MKTYEIIKTWVQTQSKVHMIFRNESVQTNFYRMEIFSRYTKSFLHINLELKNES